MDVLSRQLTPFILTMFLVLLSAVPFQVPGLARVMPLFSLIVIFHWGIYRAELLPAYAVFIIGFFQDALSGVPHGRAYNGLCDDLWRRFGATAVLCP